MSFLLSIDMFIEDEYASGRGGFVLQRERAGWERVVAKLATGKCCGLG